jgi:hypothetical protein
VILQDCGVPNFNSYRLAWWAEGLHAEDEHLTFKSQNTKTINSIITQQTWWFKLLGKLFLALFCLPDFRDSLQYSHCNPSKLRLNWSLSGRDFEYWTCRWRWLPFSGRGHQILSLIYDLNREREKERCYGSRESGENEGVWERERSWVMFHKGPPPFLIPPRRYFPD